MEHNFVKGLGLGSARDRLSMLGIGPWIDFLGLNPSLFIDGSEDSNFQIVALSLKEQLSMTLWP